MRKAITQHCCFRRDRFRMSLEISRLCQSIAPSVTLKINAMAAQLREKGQDIISLGAGEPDFDTPAFIRDAAKAALDAGETRYTAASGTPALRRSVCDFLRQEKGLTYRPDQVLICTGAKQALLNAFGSGFGFFLAMVLFSGVRGRIEDNDAPAAFKGLPITLIAAAILSVSFFGFSGVIENLFG